MLHLVQAGKLPHTARLMEEGVHGPLQTFEKSRRTGHGIAEESELDEEIKERLKDLGYMD